MPTAPRGMKTSIVSTVRGKLVEPQMTLRQAQGERDKAYFLAIQGKAITYLASSFLYSLVPGAIGGYSASVLRDPGH